MARRLYDPSGAAATSGNNPSLHCFWLAFRRRPFRVTIVSRFARFWIGRAFPVALPLNFIAGFKQIEPGTQGFIVSFVSRRRFIIRITCVRATHETQHGTE